jgi:hypothetical protein
MRRPLFKRNTKPQKSTPAPSRFGPAAFRSASPQVAQRLCEELAKQAARSFVELTGTNRNAEGSAIVQQLRASGHDLICLEDTAELQQWQATLYHPKGTFSLFLTFRAPRNVEVTWRADDVEFSAHA